MTKHNTNCITLLACLVLVLTSAVLQAEGKKHFTLSAGSYFSSGNYGLDETTYIYSLPLSIKYKKDRWNLTASTAFLRVEGNAKIYVFDDEGYVDEFGNELVVPSLESVSSVRQGLADVLVGLSYKPAWKPSSNSFVRLGGKVKLPTSDRKDNFGSGEVDTSLYAGLTVRLGRYLVNTKLGYQLMGDIKREEMYRNYNNRFFASVGGGYIMSRHWNAGLGYRFKQASIDSKEAIHKMNGFMTWRPDSIWRYTMYASFGLSSASADFASGLQVGYRL